jgi:uncharacterized iron-regulated membrane protein
MPQSRRFSLRRVFWTVHQWIGIGLFVLLVPIAVSGALLTYHDEFDALVNPKRWTVSGPEFALTPSQYMVRVSAVAEPNEVITGMRLPETVRHPVVVMARQETEGASGGRPRTFGYYLDPPTGAVLDKVDFRSSWVGFMHVFHGNLSIPQYSGRQIVGWVGIGMLILSLTGIWLWWPRHGSVASGVKWRRTPHTSHNLHQTLGFWISIPLAVVSLTGVYLSFPQQARSLMSSIAPMAPQGPRPFGAPILEKPALTADEALRLARAAEPTLRAATLFLPTAPARPKGEQGRSKGEPGSKGEKGRSKGEQGAKKGDGREGGEGRAREASSPTWRVLFRDADHNPITVTVDDQGGAARRLPDPLAGNRAAQWIRWIHDGSRGSEVWRFVVFLTGVFPAIFAVTGLMMWLRARRNRRRVASAQPGSQETLVAAE